MGGLRFDASRLSAALNKIEQRHVYGVQSYGHAVGTRMVQYAKRNRPWTDRTHAAKNRIDSTQEYKGSKLRVNLHGRMFYHIFLEFVDFRHKGRLSIFWPTISAIAPEALEGWAEVVRK